MLIKRLYLLVSLLVLPLNAGFSHNNMVTINEIKCSLNNTQKFNVGFDIDDTVLFSSPGLYHYANELCSGNIKECVKRNDFWHAMNTEADNYSLPKHIAFKLISMHQARGDNIYFITARTNSKKECVTSLLQKTFSINKINDVIFTGGNKTEFIKEKNIKMYYGDADSDMQYTRNANARPIRVLRAKNSINRSPVTIGKFDEEVLLESDL